MLSSIAHKQTYKQGIQFDNLDGSKEYNNWKAYGQSKLANLLFARHLATQLSPEQKVYAVHPGVIITNLGRHMPAVMRTMGKALSGLFMKSIPEGTATQVYAAVHPNVLGESGDYLADCNVSQSSPHGLDTAMAKQLWDVSLDLKQQLLHT